MTVTRRTGGRRTLPSAAAAFPGPHRLHPAPGPRVAILWCLIVLALGLSPDRAPAADAGAGAGAGAAIAPAAAPAARATVDAHDDPPEPMAPIVAPDDARLPTQRVELLAPLTTTVPAPPQACATWHGGPLAVLARIDVPPGSPDDLGVGAYATDTAGTWFQRAATERLHVGTQLIAIPLAATPATICEPERITLQAAQAAVLTQAGLYLWSAHPVHRPCLVRMLVVPLARCAAAQPRPADSARRPPADAGVRSAASAGARLLDLRCAAQQADGTLRGATGERWSCTVRPDPFPADPFDPDRFRLDARITAPDGRMLRIPGFAMQPMALSDRGDREDAVPDGPWRFELRFRPQLPGRYRIALQAVWSGETAGQVAVRLPDLVVAGAPWDGYARVDAHDHRFFAVDQRFLWPIGLNLHSVYDLRSRDQLGTVLTPDRGTFAYLPRLQRFAAAGGDLVEIWMGAWNLALEWRRDWPPFVGLGRYSQENAARLDRILDAAWRDGVRVNLVLNNHGQASPRQDRQWKDNPYNAALGGPLADATELFSSPVAARYQERLRRYLVGRVADHPAIFGWKLWSEVDLTASGELDMQRLRDGLPILPGSPESALVAWHAQAAARWQALDSYHHPVTTHFSGTYRRPDPAIVALPGLDYLCIDAYIPLGRRGPAGGGGSLPDLIFASAYDPEHGLAAFQKPIVITECGGSSQAGAPDLLLANLATAPFAALVTGLGASPMLWWFEWVDADDRYASFTAMRRFLQGEDLRGAQAGSVRLLVLPAPAEASAPDPIPVPDWWAAAWARPGRVLGYIVNEPWASQGIGDGSTAGLAVRIGAQVPPGRCRVSWWDPDRGTILAERIIEHPGGALDLALPAHLHHLAFKLVRLNGGSGSAFQPR